MDVSASGFDSGERGKLLQDLSNSSIYLKLLN